jgi:hypothetical protein
MPKEISLKLCLLTTLTEKSGEEVENEVSISNPENNADSADKQSPIPAAALIRSDSDEVW